MSRKDAVVMASRALSMVLTLWALAGVSVLPETVYAFLRYGNQQATSAYLEYWHHEHLIVLGFLITPIVGYSLMARWLYKGGPDVEQLFLPSAPEEGIVEA
jgi:hypothetical protein